MNLTKYYDLHGREGLNSLALRVETDAEYLWQCASIDAKTGAPRRKPGHKLCARLVGTKLGFTYESLRPDIYAKSPARPRRKRAKGTDAADAVELDLMRS